MLRRHTAVTRASCRAGALCHGAHSACVLAVACDCGPSRAWRRACMHVSHSEPIQSRASRGSSRSPLRSRCSFVGRDLTMPWVDLGFAALGPALTTACCWARSQRLGRSVQKKKMTKEGERGSVAVWREKNDPSPGPGP